MSHIIQSAGGIVYYLDKNGEPKYLLMKRYAISKKIERVAPKGKIEVGESPEQAAIRETSEEAGIDPKYMQLGPKLGVTQLRSDETHAGQLNKDTTYFLVRFTGDPNNLKIEDGGGLVGLYKWATLSEVLGLIYYQDIRELVRDAHQIIMGKQKNKDIKSAFISSL